MCVVPENDVGDLAIVFEEFLRQAWWLRSLTRLVAIASGCYSGCMPRRAIKPVPGQIVRLQPSAVEPGAVPPKGVRAALIRKTKLRYPELSEAEIAKRVGCSPSNVHQVLTTFLANRSEAELRNFQAR